MDILAFGAAVASVSLTLGLTFKRDGFSFPENSSPTILSLSLDEIRLYVSSLPGSKYNTKKLKHKIYNDYKDKCVLYKTIKYSSTKMKFRKKKINKKQK